MKLLQLALLSMALQPAGSSQPILWENLRAGMPKSEVKALYPKFRSIILGDCPVQVLSTYKDKGLRAVILVNTHNSPPCADRVLADLQAKYGPPQTTPTQREGVTVGGGFGAMTFWRNEKNHIWIVGSVQILLVTFPGSHEGYNIIYSKAPEAPVTDSH